MATTMKAFVIQGEGKAEVADKPILEIRPKFVRVKISAVALNPTDWKHIYGISSPGSTVGCDFSGVVEEIGSEVTSKVKKGDRIAGVTHGANVSSHRDGCFAEYAEVKDGLFLHVPSGMSMEAAATLGVGLITVGQGMYQSLQLPWPTSPTKTPFHFLVYGGSTATGTLAIQFAKLSGLTVIATASPRNHEMLKSLGADAVFDYNDPECAAKIREYTKNELRYVFDCISLPQAIEISAGALSSNPTPELHYSSLLPVKDFPRSDVNSRYTMAYTSMGETYEKRGHVNEGKTEHYEFARKFWTLCDQLMSEGKVKPHPLDVRSGGLGSIMQGLEDLKADKVSGKKVVYKIE